MANKIGVARRHFQNKKKRSDDEERHLLLDEFGVPRHVEGILIDCFKNQNKL